MVLIREIITPARNAAVKRRVPRQKRRSVVKRANAQKAVTVYRTTNMVQKALANQSYRPRQVYNKLGIDTAYLHCRLDPFASKGSVGLPDGSSGRKIIVDHRFYTDISFTDEKPTSFAIQTLPFLPVAAIITPLGDPDIRVNGLKITGPRPLTRNWAPCSNASSWVAGNKYMPNLLSADPFSSSKARCIAQAAKLTYMGPANTCAGLITVNPSDVGCAPGNLNKKIHQLMAGDETGDGDNEPFTNCIKVDMSTSPTAINPGGVNFRPEEGAIFVARHKTDTYEFKPIHDYPLMPVYSEADEDNTLIGSDGQSGTGATYYRGGVSWYDDDWSAAQFVVTGANADAVYRLEMVMCMEYLPTTSSGFAQMAKEMAKQNLPTLRLAEQTQRNAPIARASNSPSLFRTAMQAVGMVAPMAGAALGYPAAGIAMGAVADTLSIA